MTTEQNTLLDLVKIGVTGNCLFNETVLYADWRKLFEITCQHGVVCPAWSGIEIMFRNGVNECPQEIKLQWYAASEQAKKHCKEMMEVTAEFANAVKPLGIVALKGVDYTRFWSDPMWREFGDLDCVVVQENKFKPHHRTSYKLKPEALIERAKELGLKVEDDDYKHSRIYFKNLMVENHNCFISFAGSSEGKTLEKELRRLFDGELGKIEDSELLSPNPNFTAVYLLAHAQGHFFHEGITLRNVLDWFFFLKNEGNKVDWEIANGVLKKTGLKIFADVMTDFCIKHLGLYRKDHVSVIDPERQAQFADDLFAKKYSAKDRRWNKMTVRIINRYKRLWKFSWLNNMPVYKAIWRTIAFSSFLHRKPTLE